MFGTGKAGHRGSDEGDRIIGFVEHYGWLYVAYQYAEFYRININEVYNVQLIEFLNYLSFMKDKSEYDIETAKEQMIYNGRP